MKYEPTHVTLRDIPLHNITVSQYGNQIHVNGAYCAGVFLAADIANNKNHFLRKELVSLLPKLESGEIAAIVQTEVGGKRASIVISAEQYALGAAERAAADRAFAEARAAGAALAAKERAFDLANNEGGEGYNPYRRKTLAESLKGTEFDQSERHYPDEA